jgi:antagonist of KipI
MDKWAFWLNCLLIGNPVEAKSLEMAGKLPEILFEENVSVCITGKPVKIIYNGVEIPMLCSWTAEPGKCVRFERLTDRGWTYFGVSGGISGICNSQFVLEDPGVSAMERKLAGDELLTCFNRKEIHVIKGPEFNWLNTESKAALFESGYRIRMLNRMGYRLEGKSLRLKRTRELISSPVSTGTVQLPGNGCPVVLMEGRQTTGGYPRILNVILSDLPILSQKGENDSIVFKLVSLEEAERMRKNMHEQYRKIKEIIDLQEKPNRYNAILKIKNRYFYIHI